MKRVNERVISGSRPWVHRRDPWTYDRQTCKRRNEIERLFRRLNGCRPICSRFDKFDTLFLGFIHFALIYDVMRKGEQALE